MPIISPNKAEQGPSPNSDRNQPRSGARYFSLALFLQHWTDVVEEEVVGLIDEKEEAITGNEVRGQLRNDPSKVQLNKSGADVRLFLNELEAYVLAVEVLEFHLNGCEAANQLTATPPMGSARRLMRQHLEVEKDGRRL
ncbi:hypothetical protein K443DRAFT_6839 [Laccaria amethystina LaAM-08-1]|uniref:Uncharacterized protein n=1 Tax=Laccaria amethystina LaAM-08-1 TaxID=1095629 RepID=A0A0C9WS57_9AGAR|nr:hypothetical protein K443DRAFT_6839 [Laccaria amethystina LaAM-08-1]